MQLSGTLVVGIEYEGKLFYDFTLRERRVRDSLAVLDELGDRAKPTLTSLAYLARQVSIPGIPQEAITTDFMMDMNDEDYMTMAALEDELAKKLKARRQPSAPTA